MERKLAEYQGPEDVRECAGHFPSTSICCLPVSSQGNGPVSLDLFQRLSRLFFPYTLHMYKGRWFGMARLMGYSIGSIESYCKSGGDARLTLPVISAAEKLIAAQQIELAAIAEGLANKRRELEAKAASRPRLNGMFQVRVRDGSGIPRDAVWRGKKLEPF